MIVPSGWAAKHGIHEPRITTGNSQQPKRNLWIFNYINGFKKFTDILNSTSGMPLQILGRAHQCQPREIQNHGECDCCHREYAQVGMVD